MLFYILIVAVLLIVLIMGFNSSMNNILIRDDIGISDYLDNTKRKNYYCSLIITILLTLFLCFITAFRSDEIGNDTITYLKYFDIFSSGGLDRTRSFELGYQALNWVIGKYSVNPHVFLIIMAIIFYLPTTIYIVKYSNNLLISTVLLFSCFFSTYTSIFRQSIAMIIVAFAYQGLKRNHNVLFVVLVLLASLFHTSALIALSLLFSNLIMRYKKWVLPLAVALVIISAFGLLNVILVTIFPRYSHYFASRYASSGWLAVSYSLIRNILLFYFVDKSYDDDFEDKKYIITNFAVLLLLSSLGYAVNLFTRASDYFMLMGIVEIPNAIYFSKNKNARLGLEVLCVAMLAYFVLVLVVRPDWNHLYPYEFWS